MSRHPRKSPGTLTLVLILALICIGGLVGMLLAEGIWDWMFLVLSSSPLIIGGWRWLSSRSG